MLPPAPHRLQPRRTGLFSLLIASCQARALWALRPIRGLPDLLGRDSSQLNEPFISITEIKASVILREEPRGGKGRPGVGLLPCPGGSPVVVTQEGGPRPWESPSQSPRLLPQTLNA